MAHRFCRFLLVLAVAAAPCGAWAATEIRLEKDFLAGVVEKLPPSPFEKAGQYRGSVHSYRLAGFDPKRRSLLAAFTAEGEFQPPASGPISERVSRSKGHTDGWRKFRFEIKASVNVEAGMDGSPRFKVDVDEVKRTELEGVAGLLAKLLGKRFDEIATQVVDGKAAAVNQQLNAEIMKRASAFKDYGVFCGIDYAVDSVVLRFDLTRLKREGFVGYIHPEPRPGAAPLYRWVDMRTGAHRYTLAASPESSGRYTADGIAGYVPDAADPAAKPLYAFRGRIDNFYTPDPQHEMIRPRLFRAEGVAFNVLDEPKDGAVPFYRFFDERRGLHFYTVHPHAEFAK
ncbi:MAG: hypothetical protein P4L85_08410 [Paludisphaera borealis]|uniref:hypothetical protein n=1 Tax=Paludisphaera borealis TaxID=1387353 RepID=UPI00284CA68C|nr:hypothetical protein [Paludisphaera borealis]MDR3619359.1 hypothetical protein [Paludisphaera borealis]